MKKENRYYVGSIFGGIASMICGALIMDVTHHGYMATSMVMMAFGFITSLISGFSFIAANEKD